jgi:hypothetical protein
MQTARTSIQKQASGCRAVNSLQSVILALSLSYAVVGALLLVVLAYARVRWSAKALAVVMTSAFYVVSFVGVRGLLGWASADQLPARFKLLQSRIVEPHSLEGDSGSIYLWVEALDETNRPSGVPRAYRIPYSDRLAEKTDKAASEIAAGHPQGGLAADFGNGEGGLIQTAREFITPSIVMDMSGGDPSGGGGVAATPRGGDAVSYTPLLPPRMPPKDEQ